MSKITNEFRNHALRRGILVKPAKGTAPQNLAFAGSIELANLGFIVDPSELMGVSTQTIAETISEARKIMGADRDMTPIYPGFPQQVQKLDTMTLLVEQILHYWSAGTLLPNYPTVARKGLPIEDMLRNARNLRVLSASKASREITQELVTNPVAISVADKELLAGAIALNSPELPVIGRVIRESKNAENIQSFLSVLSKDGKYSKSELFVVTMENTMQSDVVLRALLALFTKPSHEKWEDNYRLAVNNLSKTDYRSIRMLNIPRDVRRSAIRNLGATTAGYHADKLVARKDLWRKVMTAIHPYDFNLHGSQKRALDIIHSNVEYRTLNSVIEEAMANNDVETAITAMAEYQPGNLLRRVVALLRLVTSEDEAKMLAKAIKKVGMNANLTTLISAYNGILSANDTNLRVTRVAGRNNTMVNRAKTVKISEKHQKKVLKAVKRAMVEVLKNSPKPVEPVGVVSDVPVPLVRRDISTTDKEMDRGSVISLTGDGDTLRIFSHFKNNQRTSGYMDIGAVILDENFKSIAVVTWNSWMDHRNIATYSGDKNVRPGDSASEFFDLNLGKVRSVHPNAVMVAMSIQSYSGWAINEVDIIAGAMLRTHAEEGEVFDARSVVTAFKPTTTSLQSIPLAVDLKTNEMVWIDSSSGSQQAGQTAVHDDSIGSIVYDELAREKFTLGNLAKVWAKAHGVETEDSEVDRHALLKLL